MYVLCWLPFYLVIKFMAIGHYVSIYCYSSGSFNLRNSSTVFIKCWCIQKSNSCQYKGKCDSCYIVSTCSLILSRHSKTAVSSEQRSLDCVPGIEAMPCQAVTAPAALVASPAADHIQVGSSDVTCNGRYSSTTWMSRYQKGKPFCTLMQQEQLTNQNWKTCRAPVRSPALT